MNAFFAVFKHESDNKDTVARIRRSLRHRFTQGGVVQTVDLRLRQTPRDQDRRRAPSRTPRPSRSTTLVHAGSRTGPLTPRSPTGSTPRGSRPALAAAPAAGPARCVPGPPQPDPQGGPGPQQEDEPAGSTRPAAGARSRPRRRSASSGAVPHLAFIEPARFDRVIALLTPRNAEVHRGARAGADTPARTSPGSGPSGRVSTSTAASAAGCTTTAGTGSTEPPDVLAGPATTPAGTRLTVRRARGPPAKLADAVLAAVASPARLRRRCSPRRCGSRSSGSGRPGRPTRRPGRPARTLDRQLVNVRTSLRDAGSARALIEDLDEARGRTGPAPRRARRLDRSPGRRSPSRPPVSSNPGAGGLRRAGPRLPRVRPADAAAHPADRGPPLPALSTAGTRSCGPLDARPGGARARGAGAWKGSPTCSAANWSSTCSTRRRGKRSGERVVALEVPGADRGQVAAGLG